MGRTAATAAIVKPLASIDKLPMVVATVNAINGLGQSEVFHLKNLFLVLVEHSHQVKELGLIPLRLGP